MLINFSNHRLNTWSSKQISIAKKYGKIIDIEFPHIQPNLNEREIKKISQKYFKKITRIIKSSKDKSNAVHIMGEMTFTFHLISLLLNAGIKCIASTTNRIVKENPDHTKITKFEFVRFRKYV